MRIITPAEVAGQTQNKYLGVLVAAKFARYVNDFPRDRSVDWEEKLTTRRVLPSVGGRGGGRALPHIDLAQVSDLVIVAPATANILARAAMGRADALLPALLPARGERPVLAAPAMNDAMYANPATSA